MLYSFWSSSEKPRSYPRKKQDVEGDKTYHLDRIMNHVEISLPLLAEGAHGDRKDDGSNVASKVGKRPPRVEDEIKHDVRNRDAHERNEDRLEAFGVGGVEFVKSSHEFEAN